jgi:Flp pilus assembly protein TadB
VQRVLGRRRRRRRRRRTEKKKKKQSKEEEEEEEEEQRRRRRRSSRRSSSRGLESRERMWLRSTISLISKDAQAPKTVLSLSLPLSFRFVSFLFSFLCFAYLPVL